MAAHSPTGQPSYLTHAKSLADCVLRELSNAEGCGFYHYPSDPAALGAIGSREAPCRDKVTAARFFARLYRPTGEMVYRDAVEGALRLCGFVMADPAD